MIFVSLSVFLVESFLTRYCNNKWLKGAIIGTQHNNLEICSCSESVSISCCDKPRPDKTIIIILALAFFFPFTFPITVIVLLLGLCKETTYVYLEPPKLQWLLDHDS